VALPWHPSAPPADDARIGTDGVRVYQAGVALLSILFVGIGIALLAVTAVRGGGIGYVLGALFIAAGSARLYLLVNPRGRRGLD